MSGIAVGLGVAGHWTKNMFFWISDQAGYDG
jgi:hypothetical protein